jgi:2-polyprenyl-3-methyl-5-hydroxy-6-metoxy-1,4-benzoquinol methylase
MKALRVPRQLLRDVVEHLPRAEVNETAVPSYTHPNPFIRRLFWQRLDTALRLAQVRPTDRVLDFGTGSGILLPTLTRCAKSVTATDLDVSPAQSLMRHLSLAPTIVAPENFAAWTAAHTGVIDLIFALDVFEHLSEVQLPIVGNTLRALLAPGGRMIVSGPTESVMYRIGRFIAGFRNVYHYRSVFDIDDQLQRDWRTEEAAFLPRLPRAFLITRYVPRTQA